MRNRITQMILSGIAVVSLCTGNSQIVLAADQTPAPYYEVTEAMTNASYWSDKVENPNAVLISQQGIDALNKTFMNQSETNMFDLTHYSDTVDGIAISNSLSDSVKNSFSNIKKMVREGGGNFTEEDCQTIFEEAVNPNAVQAQKVQFAICTTRSDLKSYPTDLLMLDTADDLDSDNNQISSVRVNEPMVIVSVSKNRKFYYGYTSNCQGWVRAEDFALCSDRLEWVLAWNIPWDEAFVVTGDRISLEYTNNNRAISNEELNMGTVLRVVAEADYPKYINNRMTYYNYVVYVPIRDADGSYSSTMALISQNEDVHVGYLELTTSNLISQAYKSLGNIYGWGGMLHSNDCSGYMRDVYKCFGLEIPRNTTWQKAMQTEKYDMSKMTTEQKKDLLDHLAPGAILFMSGHEMMYLGSENGVYYVISAIGSVIDMHTREFNTFRSYAITSLNVLRGSGKTWLESMTTAVVPFSTMTNIAYAAIGNVSGIEESYMYQGEPVTPQVSIAGLTENIDYTVSYSNHTAETGTESPAVVTITGIGNYYGTTNITFEIIKTNSHEVLGEGL